MVMFWGEISNYDIGKRNECALWHGRAPILRGSTRMKGLKLHEDERYFQFQDFR
jgi:hypothetical protein